MLATLFALLPLLALTSATPIIKRQSGVLIESGRNPGQCLSALGGRIRFEANPLGNDTPVVTMACDVASLWDISKGSGSVLITGTKYALDIGLTPSNNGGLKVCLRQVLADDRFILHTLLLLLRHGTLPMIIGLLRLAVINVSTREIMDLRLMSVLPVIPIKVSIMYIIKLE